jgi:hypothetical protein
MLISNARIIAGIEYVVDPPSHVCCAPRDVLMEEML